MFRKLASVVIAMGFLAVWSVSAHASPACMKDKKPFALAEDNVTWTMSATPGSECIQGLRWSYMQIYSVAILKAPTKGKLVIVGSGFRYFADPESRGNDSFTLLIDGKNRHDLGKSTLEIAITRSPATVVGELSERPSSN